MAFVIKSIIPIFYLIFLIFSGCSVTKELGDKSDFSENNFTQGHYIYEDNMVTLSALIQKSDFRAGFEYILLIINRSSSPIPLNYYSDILTISYEGKIYSLRKSTRNNQYPHSLEPGKSIRVVFQLDGTFSPVVYKIDYLIFKLGEKRYILKRNPQALWQDRETLY